MQFHTPAFEAFVLPARAKPQFWRLIAGLVLFSVIYVGFVAGLTTLALWLQPAGFSAAEIEMNTRPSMIVGLLSFLGGVLGVWAAARLLHRRKLSTLFGPAAPTLGKPPTFWRNFAVTAAIVFIAQGALMLATSLYFGVIPNQPLSMVLLFFPLGVILLLIQTGAEELLFRGYIMQQLGARFASPLIWLVLPSVVFGVIHYDPENMGTVAGWILLALTVSGLVWADLTRITGNIGAAWGWHFMNNLMVLNFITMKGTMEGFSWKLTSFGPEALTPWSIMPDVALSIGIWLVLRHKLRPTP